jgi:hypothetical protein
LPCRQTKRRRPSSGGRWPSAWDGPDREAKIFLESVLHDETKVFAPDQNLTILF